MTHTTINHGLPLHIPPDLFADKPVRMLNLLRFRPQAVYDTATTTDLPTVSGQEAYLNRYIPAFTAVADVNGGAQVIFLSTSTMGVVGPSDEHWDIIALIEYPSIKHFESIIGSKEYKQTAEIHRLASLQDWRLIACAE